MIISVIFGIVIPVGVQVLDIQKSTDMYQVSPRVSSGMDALRATEEYFPPGIINPLYVVISSGKVNSTKSNSFFDAISQVSASLVEHTSCAQDNVMDITLEGYVDSWDNSRLSAKTLLNVNFEADPCELYQYLWDTAVDSSNSSTIITITTPFDPLGNEMDSFVGDVRTLLKDSSLPSEYGYFMAGESVWLHDAVEACFDSFPMVIIVVIGSIFFAIGCFFRSVFIPLRYAVTLVFPLAATFGLAVLVYQKGMLSWMSADAVSKQGTIYWLVPILTFPICVGLALDYGIALL